MIKITPRQRKLDLPAPLSEIIWFPLSSLTGHPGRRCDFQPILQPARGSVLALSAYATILGRSLVLASSPESGERAGYDGGKRKKGSKLHIAVDTLGNLLALRVTAANVNERAEVGALTREVQAVTDNNVEVAFVDQGYDHGDSVLELLHISRQKFDRLIRFGACILIADEICWRWSWQAWHAWCANLSGIL